MKRFLNFLRWFIAIPLLIVLFIVTTIAIPASSITSNFTNRNKIKSWGKESGIYDNFENIAFAIIDSQSKSTIPDSEGSEGESGEGFAELKAQIKDPNSDIGKLADEVLTPQFLEQSVNTIVDAFYDFLERKTQKPTFRIVITEDKNTMIKIFSIGFKEKVKNLSECHPNFVITPDFDPINTDCRPKNFDLNQIDTYIAENIDDETLDALLSHAVFDSETIKYEPQSLANVQKVFSVAVWVPLGALGLIVLLSGLLILIIPNFKTSFSVVGIVVGSVSLALIVISILGFVYYNNIHDSFYLLAPSTMRVVYDSYFRAAIKNVYDDLVKSNLIFSILGFVYGIGLIGISYLFKKKED